MNNKSLQTYGYTEFFSNQEWVINKWEEVLIPARVIQVHREQYRIVSGYEEKNARLKGSIFYNQDKAVMLPAIGDFVLIKRNLQGDDTIYKVFERKSKFSRLDSFNNVEQLVATNFDYVFIMTSLNEDFNLKRIERYLASAWQSGGEPVIVLTKSDLCSNSEEYKAKLENMAIGVPIITLSSLTKDGFDQLQDYIEPGKTIVFLGTSGVGKSSLINAIAGEELMKVNAIRENDARGRHTTTHRELVMLKRGTMIIDTPGMRELGMWAVNDGIEITFDAISKLAEKCKFKNCSHVSEPGCAVKKALENGDLSMDRWNNYRKLEKEAAFALKKEKEKMRNLEKSKKSRKHQK